MSVRDKLHKMKEVAAQADDWRNEHKEGLKDASDVLHHRQSLTGVAKKRLKNFSKQKLKQMGKKAGKMALRAVKAGAHFLFFTPPGWIICGIIFALLINAGGHKPAQNKYIDRTNETGTQNAVTTDEYTALMTQNCDVNGPEADDSISYAGGSIANSKLSYSQLKKFANSGIQSTWGVSISKAETYFLTHNSRVAAQYGLNKHNIGRISNIVRREGVSPVFFWCYAVNEGGGAGGFINHFTSSSGNAATDARADAKYIYQESHNDADHAATGGGEPGDLPTAEANKLYKSLARGSIGKVYIPATSAVTAEIETIAGHEGDWSHTQYGRPLSQTYAAIKSLGGDPRKASKPDNKQLNGGGAPGAIDIDGDNGDSDDQKCNDEQTDDSGLSDGGMNLDKARSFMSAFYHKHLTASDYSGAAPGSPDVHDNCTVFSAFFITNYTTLKTGGGNGYEVVGNLAKANGSKLKVSHTPSVYSIFSIKPNEGGVHNIAMGSAGHTGVVLGIDKKKGVAIIGQGEYGHSFTSTSDWNSGVNAQEIPLKVMNAKNGWSFVDVNKYLNKKPK